MIPKPRQPLAGAHFSQGQGKEVPSLAAVQEDKGKEIT